MPIFKHVSRLVAVAALVCGGVSEAGAAFKISLNNRARVVTDNYAGDLSPLLGVIIANFTTDEFSVLVSVGQSKPVLAKTAMTLSVTYTATGVAGTTMISITDTDFLRTRAGIFAAAGGNQARGVTAEWQATMDQSNTEFGVGFGGILSLGPLTGTQGATGSRRGFGTGRPFSMSGQIILTSAGGNAGSGGSVDVGVQQVPEPATVVIWSLLSCVGLAAGWRQRRRRKTAYCRP